MSRIRCPIGHHRAQGPPYPKNIVRSRQLKCSANHQTMAVNVLKVLMPSPCLALFISQGYFQCQIFCSIIPNGRCLSDRRGDDAVKLAVQLTTFADVVKVGGPFESRPKHLTAVTEVGSSFSSDPSRSCPDIALNYATPPSI